VEHFDLGQPASDRFRAAPEIWDAAIIDLELPDISGEKLLPVFYSLRPTLPIVVYSGMPGVKERLELYSSGATAVLSKPTAGQDILDVLKGLVESPPEPIR
jgi:FixJ family two-component response regulator